MTLKLGNRRFFVRVQGGRIETIDKVAVSEWDSQVVDLLQEQVTRQTLLTQVRDYINEELRSGKKDDATSFTSALINTIDTACEGPELRAGLQKDSEIRILQFILSHKN